MPLTSKDIRINAIIAVFFIAWTWMRHSGGWDGDLSAIYFAAYSFGIGEYDLLYLAEPGFFGSSASLEWEVMAADFGFPKKPVLPYIYAPIWAAVLAPLALAMPPAVFFDVFLIVHALACAGSVFLAWRIAAPTGVSLTVWSIVSYVIITTAAPFEIGFWLNQPQFVVTFLVLLAFDRYRVGAFWAAGIALGLAAAIKITPAVFVVIFLMDRNWKPAIATVLAGGAMLALSFAVAGVDLHVAFLEQLNRASSNMVLTKINFSLEGVIASWQSEPGLILNPDDTERPFVVSLAHGWIGMACKVALLIFAAALWWVTRHAKPDTALYGRLMALWCAIIFFGPLGWSHYLIGPLMLLPGLLGRMKMPWAAFWILIVGVIVSQPLGAELTALGASRPFFMALGALSLVIMMIVGTIAARR